MTLTNCRATFGLNAIATPTNGGASGSLQVGLSNASLNLSDATKIHSFEAVIADSSSNLVVDVSDLDGTGSTAWTSGAAQVETATCAGTISAGGNASVTVTAAGMTGSPKTISVAVATSDNANAWATKVRAALTADADVSSMFTVSGATDKVILTRKPTKSYTINGSTVNLYAANDATLNIALADGTSTGVTTAATSANTTAGVVTAGVYAPDLTGNDVFGDSLTGLTSLMGFFLKSSTESTDAVAIILPPHLDYPILAGGSFCVAASMLTTGDFTIASSGNSKVTVTIAGA